MLSCRYPAYGALYTALEILALPAVPLTMTAGLLFGVGPGAAVVSVSSTLAATIAFLIARYAGKPLLHPSLLAVKFLGLDDHTDQSSLLCVTASLCITDTGCILACMQ